MKDTFFLLVLFLWLSFMFACKSEENYLIKVYEGPEDYMGVPSGYVNQQGDTIIPLGKYEYCFTDTLSNFGIVLKKDGTCVAIDRNGAEMYEVYWYDNGPDYLSDGLFRMVKNGKIGYAGRDGAIVIPPQFSCADPFENGKARVTFDCVSVPDGEHTISESSSWFYIDKRGNRMPDTQ